MPTDAGPRIRLVENDFPYQFAEDVAQIVLWSLEPLLAEDAENFVRQELASRGYGEYCCAINEEFQTIPGIWHMHVIARVPGFS